jgi:hypothetical protein
LTSDLSILIMTTYLSSCERRCRNKTSTKPTK